MAKFCKLKYLAQMSNIFIKCFLTQLYSAAKSTQGNFFGISHIPEHFSMSFQILLNIPYIIFKVRRCVSWKSAKLSQYNWLNITSLTRSKIEFFSQFATDNPSLPILTVLVHRFVDQKQYNLKFPQKPNIKSIETNIFYSNSVQIVNVHSFYNFHNLYTATIQITKLKIRLKGARKISGNLF